MMRRLPRLRALGQDRRGVALTEFAFVLPFMVLLFCGGYQLMDAISAYRKVTFTVRSLADLTTRNTTMTDSQADEILNASKQVMAPYSPDDASLRISQVQVQGDGKAKVIWSRALNGTALSTDSKFILSTDLAKQNNKYFIFSEINYTYTPKIAPGLIGTIPLSQTIFMSPRNSEFVAYN